MNLFILFCYRWTFQRISKGSDSRVSFWFKGMERTKKTTSSDHISSNCGTMRLLYAPMMSVGVKLIMQHNCDLVLSTYKRTYASQVNYIACYLTSCGIICLHSCWSIFHVIGIDDCFIGFNFRIRK